MTPTVSLATAAALTGLSTRTLRRWIVEGRAIVQRVDVPHDPAGRTFVELDPLRMHIGLALAPADVERVMAADGGDAQADNDVALLFLTARRYTQAVRWLERAAAGGDADAMHWLGRCCLAGWGVVENRREAWMWLERAADAGHTLSKLMLDAIRMQETGHGEFCVTP